MAKRIQRVSRNSRRETKPEDGPKVAERIVVSDVFEDDDNAVIDTPSRSLHSPGAPEVGLQNWAEALAPYEDAFPQHDEAGAKFVATIEEIIQTIAQWYVRKNNKYYDVDVPGEVLSRDDVERVITQRLRVAFPGNENLAPDVVRQLLQKVIRDVFVSPRESIPIWCGFQNYRTAISLNPGQPFQ